jgi:hypothetical protein
MNFHPLWILSWFSYYLSPLSIVLQPSPNQRNIGSKYSLILHRCMEKDHDPATVERLEYPLPNLAHPLPQLKEPLAQWACMWHRQRRAIHLQHLNRLPKLKPLTSIQRLQPFSYRLGPLAHPIKDNLVYTGAN